MGSEDFNDRRIDAYTQAYREIVDKKPLISDIYR